MDKLKNWPNVIILTTSNITTAIDIVFVDRADIKAYVGSPTFQAQYEILRSCIQELVCARILTCSQSAEAKIFRGSVDIFLSPSSKNAHATGTPLNDCDHHLLPNYSTLKEKLHSSDPCEHQSSLEFSRLLLEAAEACQGLSGTARSPSGGLASDFSWERSCKANRKDAVAQDMASLGMAPGAGVDKQDHLCYQEYICQYHPPQLCCPLRLILVYFAKLQQNQTSNLLMNYSHLHQQSVVVDGVVVELCWFAAVWLVYGLVLGWFLAAVLLLIGWCIVWCIGWY